MYQLTESSSIICLSNSTFIPADPDNRDYADYLSWIDKGNTPMPAAPKTAEQLREEWKAERAAAVKAITVTTAAGNTFDGDEESQGRMARAILALPLEGTVTWVLADNSAIQVTAAELTEALALAGAEQARLWIDGFSQTVSQ